jgi:GTPase SAR1 family protein
MAREPLKLVAVGGTGVGKTHTSMKFVKNIYSNPRNPNARKTLIYDTNMEFKDIKPIAPQDIPAFNRQKTIEIRRILPIDLDTGKELGMDDKYELLCDIIDNYNFRNGLLYLEDINNYVTNAHTKHLINLLTTNRHKLLDIFINLQTFGALPPRLWGNVNILRVHQCNDTPFQTKIKNQLSGKIEVLRIADILVSQITETRDPRFYVTVDFRTMKITGNFTTDEFIEACRKYLALNQKLVKNEMKMNKLTQEKATEKCLVRFMRLYNANVELKSKKK